MAEIKPEWLDDLVADFNIGDEVSRHNALLATIIKRLRSERAPVNCRYTSYFSDFTTNGAMCKVLQILPENPNRKFLQIYSNNGQAFYFNFETGPTAPYSFDQNLAPETYQDFITKSFQIGNASYFLPGNYWSAFGNPVPTNPVTIMQFQTTRVMVVEGI